MCFNTEYSGSGFTLVVGSVPSSRVVGGLASFFRPVSCLGGGPSCEVCCGYNIMAVVGYLGSNHQISSCTGVTRSLYGGGGRARVVFCAGRVRSGIVCSGRVGTCLSATLRGRRFFVCLRPGVGMRAGALRNTRTLIE